MTVCCFNKTYLRSMKLGQQHLFIWHVVLESLGSKVHSWASVWLEALSADMHRRHPAAFRHEYDSYGCRQTCDTAHLYISLRQFQTQREWSDSNPGSGDCQPGAAMQLWFLAFVQTFDIGSNKIPFLLTLYHYPPAQGKHSMN